MEPSYIGITGFTKLDDIHATTRLAQRLGYPGERSIMFGYLTSENRVREPTQRGTRSPAVRDLPALVAAAPSWSIPMLHYHTKHPERMRADIDELVTATGAPAVQLNMPWPDRDDIAALVDKHAGLNVVLQLPARAMDGLTKEQTAERAARYDGLVAYALIDRSGGTGIAFDLEPTAALVRALEDAMPRTTIAVAGGFTPENVGDRLRFLDGHAKRPYAIDAESGVMTDNALDLRKIEIYLARAMGLQL